ncbi:hypothetical protein D3C71_866950 [compost metagenome]
MMRAFLLKHLNKLLIELLVISDGCGIELTLIDLRCMTQMQKMNSQSLESSCLNVKCSCLGERCGLEELKLLRDEKPVNSIAASLRWKLFTIWSMYSGSLCKDAELVFDQLLDSLQASHSPSKS